jgi:hypothetical protein
MEVMDSGVLVSSKDLIPAAGDDVRERVRSEDAEDCNAAGCNRMLLCECQKKSVRILFFFWQQQQ